MTWDETSRREGSTLVRERALRCACAALGIGPPILLDYRDGTLSNADEEQVVGEEDVAGCGH